MRNRDVSLNSRSVETRNAHQVTKAIEFDLKDIKKHYEENMESVRKQYKIADDLVLQNKKEEAETIWRSQVVLFEGILDFYLHEIAKYGISQIYKEKWSYTEQYNNITIPLETVLTALDPSKKSDNWLFDFINTKYSRSVFMSADSVKDILNLTGIKYVEVMERVFSDEKSGKNVSEKANKKPNKNEKKNEKKNENNKAKKLGDNLLNKLYYRRNLISHQLDREHSTADKKDIDKNFVEQYAANIEKIILSIHAIAEQKDLDFLTKTKKVSLD